MRRRRHSRWQARKAARPQVSYRASWIIGTVGGTTVWVDEGTRDALRERQAQLGARSVNETIRRLLATPGPDARSLFALHRKEIGALMRRHGVRALTAFGSRARGDASPGSDLDVAVRMRPRVKPIAVLAFEADIETLLGIPVNAVELPNARIEAVLAKEGVAFGS